MILPSSTSLPRTVTVNSTTSAGAVLAAAPGAGKSIILIDLINGDGTHMASLKEETDGSGALLAQVPAGGAISLNAPIKVTANKAVHVATSTKFTATYLIEG